MGSQPFPTLIFDVLQGKYGALKIQAQVLVIFELAPYLMYIKARFYNFAHIMAGCPVPLVKQNGVLQSLHKWFSVHNATYLIYVGRGLIALIHVCVETYNVEGVPSYIE